MWVIRRTPLSLQSILERYQCRVLVIPREELGGGELGENKVRREKAKEGFPEHHCRKVWGREGSLGGTEVLGGVLWTNDAVPVKVIGAPIMTWTAPARIQTLGGFHRSSSVSYSSLVTPCATYTWWPDPEHFGFHDMQANVRLPLDGDESPFSAQSTIGFSTVVGSSGRVYGRRLRFETRMKSSQASAPPIMSVPVRCASVARRSEKRETKTCAKTGVG